MDFCQCVRVLIHIFSRGVRDQGTSTIGETEKVEITEVELCGHSVSLFSYLLQLYRRTIGTEAFIAVHQEIRELCHDQYVRACIQSLTNAIMCNYMFAFLLSSSNDHRVYLNIPVNDPLLITQSSFCRQHFQFDVPMSHRIKNGK